jgi:hypothetical protein
LIYLPPTGSTQQHKHRAIPSHLINSNALARINYRWNHIPPPPRSSSPESPSPSPLSLSSHPSYANHPFPTPLHDTLHAYTFLINSFLPSFSSRSQTSSSSPYTSKFSPKSAYYTPPTTKHIQRPLIIYGSYLGGTLATSLALTESFASKQLPQRIAGLIVKNGIFDWSGIGTSLPPESPSLSQEGEWNEKSLHAIKYKLFTGPASTFDWFVSPVLFFRTAGLNVPKLWPGTEPPDPQSQSMPGSSATTSPPSSPDNEITDIKKRITELELDPQRKTHLKFPSRDSELKIPRSLFLTSSPSPSPSKTKRKKSKGEEISPAAQAEEMAGLIRRSVLLHEFKDRKVWDEDLDVEGAAEERVWVRSLDGEEEGEMVKEWVEDGLE